MARQIGISLSEYNEMTPHELVVCADVFAEQTKNEQEGELFLAYINAYWQRVDPLKSFEEMTGIEGKKKKEMTQEEMLAKVMGLNTMFGGTVE